MQIKNNYDLLLSKLDQFIRKYYINKLIRGTLYTLGLVMAAFLCVSLMEYFFYFSTTVRKVLFYGFLSLAGLTTIVGIFVPLLQLFKLGKIISHKQAAAIIGTHFSGVKDKLLNILQLKEQAVGYTDASLIEASINQKIEDIKLVPFSAAIDLSKNREYLKYAALPLLAFGAILLGAPRLITESATRLIQNDREFEREAPFHFEIINQDSLEVVQFNDIDVRVKVTGSLLPNEAFIHINNFPYKLRKLSPNTFSYTLNKVQKDTPFFIEADGVRSKDYTVQVIPKPAMLNFDAIVSYPPYTGKKNETLRNGGDMIVPTGTQITWKFEAENTDAISARFGNGKEINAEQQSPKTYSLNRRLFNDTPYTIFLSNNRLNKADSIAYNVSVIPDLHPTIQAEEKRDSADAKYLYFLGDAADDYGIKNLYFKYKVAAEGDNSESGYQQIPIDIGGQRSAASFTHTFDINALAAKAGSKVLYFFEVWDNDAVNGSKSARTPIMTYEIPSIKQMEQLAEKNNEELKDEAEKLMEDAEKLRKDAKKMQEKLVEQKNMDWNDKEKLQKLVNDHQQLQERIEKMQENFKNNNEQQKEFKQFSEETKEKQEKLQEMMENLMSDEMRELMQKLEKLLEEMDKEKIMEEMEKFEMTDENVQRELDRMLELFKELEMEQKMNETIDKLNKLAEEQEKLSDKTEQNTDNNLNEEQKEQEKMNEEFKDIQKDIDKLEEMGKELGKEQKLNEETDQEQQEIGENQQQSMENMQGGENQKASKKQKKAAQKMKDMASKMQAMQMQQQMESAEEDMEAIRQLLENLIDLSLDQEKLMDGLQAVDINTPNYVSLMQQQQKIKDDSQIVEDSLVALSKRVFQLETFITEELGELKRNIGGALEKMEERRKSEVLNHQQYAMTSINNLALMLDEALQQMQQQMMSMMQGQGSCSKPGGKGMKSMGQMQKQLNDQISKLQQDMKDGKKPGKQFSKEAAQLAAKQAAIRQAIEQMQKEGQGGKEQENTPGKGELGKIAEQMNQTETQLVNKQLTAEMLKRQQDILDKLLKAADAERERDKDDQREAQTGKAIVRKTPPEVEEYLKKRQAEIEMYKTVPPNLKPYYKDLVERYFQSIGF